MPLAAIVPLAIFELCPTIIFFMTEFSPMVQFLPIRLFSTIHPFDTVEPANIVELLIMQLSNVTFDSIIEFITLESPI